MLREMVIIAVFLAVVSGILSSIASIQRTTSYQEGIAEKIIGSANEAE